MELEAAAVTGQRNAQGVARTCQEGDQNTGYLWPMQALCVGQLALLTNQLVLDLAPVLKLMLGGLLLP